MADKVKAYLCAYVMEGSERKYVAKSEIHAPDAVEINTLLTNFEGVFDEENNMYLGSVHVDNVTITKSRGKTASKCAYNSSQEYLTSHFGRRLNEGDSNWYDDHPYTEPGGLGKDHTITLLNDLVAPYGVGVSKVYVRSGSLAQPDHKLWWEVLGINPLAREYQNVSNEDFRKKSLEEGLTDEILKSFPKFNFEYVDTLPSGPMITCSSNHATFRGCRCLMPRDWEMAICYDYIDKCVYHTTPPTYNALDFKENVVYSFLTYTAKSETGETFGALTARERSKNYKSNWDKDWDPISYRWVDRNNKDDEGKKETPTQQPQTLPPSNILPVLNENRSGRQQEENSERVDPFRNPYAYDGTMHIKRILVPLINQCFSEENQPTGYKAKVKGISSHFPNFKRFCMDQYRTSPVLTVNTDFTVNIISLYERFCLILRNEQILQYMLARKANDLLNYPDIEKPFSKRYEDKLALLDPISEALANSTNCDTFSFAVLCEDRYWPFAQYILRRTMEIEMGISQEEFQELLTTISEG